MHKKTEQNDFLSLLTANQRRIYGFILSRVPHIPEAEDILQETTATMWQRFSDFTPGTDFVSWGIAIAHYKLLEHRKKMKKAAILNDEALKAIEDTSRNRQVADDDRLQYLRDCMKKLTRSQQELLWMRYEQDISMKVISERMGKSAGYLYKLMGQIHGKLMWCVKRSLAMEEERHAR